VKPYVQQTQGYLKWAKKSIMLLSEPSNVQPHTSILMNSYYTDLTPLHEYCGSVAMAVIDLRLIPDQPLRLCSNHPIQCQK
jgi:hypothetical protein